MPRQKLFDPQEVLDRAVLVFWERGQDGASVQDLVDAMGVNRFSLYTAFGDKHRLFLAALDRYGEQVTDRMLADLTRPGASVAEIGAYLDGLVRAVASGGPARFGCLMANTMSDLAVAPPAEAGSAGPDAGPPAHAAGVLPRLLAHLDRLTAAFEAALTTAAARREIRPDLDPAAHARLLAVTVQGISACARLGHEDLLRQTVEAAMDALTGPPAPANRPR
ncbi:TetR/AcrR family transcriptional regulator [Streptomyces sp. ODS05-4]|uniref:TetR/AcrR family transcriptional regulator n=1 Tax=Streptomyces sp. ODS05-4 TaxID=2944939 RepID=UPI00210E5ECC|nr:TetR/AcrR family transcriptional regulator [Streptomyces sp. ODS05-4]